jgi:DNA-binding LacI/PurR family transcriptional regulator
MAYNQQEQQQAFERFVEMAARRRLEPGLKVPGELALSHELGLSRHMVRVLLKRLSSDGIVQRRGRSGTYLLREPTPGTVPVPDRSQAPVMGSGRTIALMLGFPVGASDLHAIQSYALQQGYLLQTYFSGEHAHSSQEEREYLEHAMANGYAGALIHGTPLSPDNEAFFRSLSAHLRLAHIGYHAEDLPAQSFFLPDLPLGGALCAAHLASRGCRRVTLLSGLPEGHHFPSLILRGISTAAAAAGMKANVVSHYEQDRDEVLSAIDAKSDHGLVISSWSDPTRDNEMQAETLAAIAESHPCIVISERVTETIPPHLPACLFHWQRAVTDALTWIMSDTPAVQHRLYPPTIAIPLRP